MIEYFNLDQNKVDALYLLLDSGAGEKETATRLRLPVESVRYYKNIRQDSGVTEVSNLEESLKELVPELSNRNNEDRHLCRMCIHRAKNLSDKAVGSPGCDYICNTDKERGCDVECCNKFEEGESLSLTRARIRQKKERQKRLEAEAKRAAMRNVSRKA